MKTLIAVSVTLAILVVFVWVYAYQAFIESERTYREARIELELRARKHCEVAWPLRGAHFERCIKEGIENGL